MDPRSFWRSKGSRRPSRLTTCGRTSSMYSWVVYRRWHLRHSRRRRMNSPSRPTRESTTRSSVWPQNGHFTGRVPLSGAPLRVEREAVRQLLDLVADRGFHGYRPDLRQRAIDQARDLGHLRLAHPTRGHGGRAQAGGAPGPPAPCSPEGPCFFFGGPPAAPTPLGPLFPCPPAPSR